MTFAKRTFAVLLTFILGLTAIAVPTASALEPQTMSTAQIEAEKLTDAQKFVRKIKVGWNLGNTLDAIGTTINSETGWGNPKTTKKMIKDIKAAGFNAIRIPVTWSGHVDKKGKVNKEWMDRVQEVVDYAYSQKMYIILNSHHDNSYYDVGIAGDKTKEKENIAKMMRLWKQIAARFEDYDEHLIFEALNEPRDEKSNLQWNGGTQAHRDYIAKLNKNIVTQIRAGEGYNKTRYIMCPTNAATSMTNILRNAEFPDDDRVIISVHYYKWDDFTNSDGKFSDAEKKGMETFFSELNDIFVKNGRAVIIGECGSTNRKNDSVRAEWASTFIKNGKKYGIPVFFWDNGADNEGQENYMLYNRKEGKFPHPKIISAIKKASTDS